MSCDAITGVQAVTAAPAVRADAKVLPYRRFRRSSKKRSHVSVSSDVELGLVVDVVVEACLETAVDEIKYDCGGVGAEFDGRVGCVLVRGSDAFTTVLNGDLAGLSIEERTIVAADLTTLV